MEAIKIINKDNKIIITKRIEDNDTIQKLQKTVVGQFGALIGGAVVDIALGKRPKDFDIVGLPESYHRDGLGDEFTFVSETQWAFTYKFNSETVQFLKKNEWDFEFKISQSKYEFNSGRLTIDKLSFDNRTLIPVSFHNTVMLKEGLMRLPHWRRKGFDMCDTTYLSILEVLFHVPAKNS